jgi:hypothetical protein
MSRTLSSSCAVRLPVTSPGRTFVRLSPSADWSVFPNLAKMIYKLCVKGEADKLLSVRDVYGYQLWNGERLVKAVSLRP